MKFKWTDILIIVVVILAFGYFYSRFDLDEQPANSVLVDTQLDTPSATDKEFLQSSQNRSEQLFAGDLWSEDEIKQGEVIDSHSSPQSDRCKQEKEILFEQRTDLTAYALSEQEANNLVMLTGRDWNSGIDSKNLTEEERLQWFNEVTEKQLKLLKEQHAKDTDPLIAQLYLEKCSLNDKPDLCPLEELEAIAEEYSDNLAGWLSLLQYYSNRNAPEKMKEIVSRAADSIYIEWYEYEFKQRLYRDYLQVYNSPQLAILAVYQARGNRLIHILSIARYCREYENANCYKIGETLEQSGNTIEAKSVGMNIQKMYLEKSEQQSFIPNLQQRLDDLQMAVKEYVQPFRILLDDQMAMFMIDSLDIRDEVEYYRTVSEEAQRLLEENPEICAW